MTITSSGYDGEVSEAKWSTDLFPNIGLSQYGVVGKDDWKTTIVGGSDRTVSISAGAGWGKGIFDRSDAAVQVQLATIASGTRWDMVVMNRNWAGVGGLSQFTAITGGTARTLPGRNTTPGTLDDQPVALVQLVAGQTAPQAVVDLRCWAGPGGLEAVDVLAKNYLQFPGVALKIGSDLQRYSPNTSGVWAWISFVPPVVTLSNAGLMSAANLATLNAAASTTYANALGTSVDTPSTIMRRDSAGRARVDDPSNIKDIVNKEYADALGTSVDTPSTIMRRDSAGRARVDEPATGKDITNKTYVDGRTTSGLASGSITLAIGPANTFISSHVNLTAYGFTAAPNITVSITSNPSYPATRLNAYAINKSATGFDAKLATADGQTIGTSYSITIDWIASQP